MYNKWTDHIEWDVMLWIVSGGLHAETGIIMAGQFDLSKKESFLLREVSTSPHITQGMDESDPAPKIWTRS